MTESCPQKIIYARHALFEKEGFTGQIGLICVPAHNFIAVQYSNIKGQINKRFSTRQVAERVFEEYIIAAAEIGWTLIYNGGRNSG